MLTHQPVHSARIAGRMNSRDDRFPSRQGCSPRPIEKYSRGERINGQRARADPILRHEKILASAIFSRDIYIRTEWGKIGAIRLGREPFFFLSARGIFSRASNFALRLIRQRGYREGRDSHTRCCVRIARALCIHRVGLNSISLPAISRPPCAFINSSPWEIYIIVSLTQLRLLSVIARPNAEASVPGGRRNATNSRCYSRRVFRILLRREIIANTVIRSGTNAARRDA